MNKTTKKSVLILNREGKTFFAKTTFIICFAMSSVKHRH